MKSNSNADMLKLEHKELLYAKMASEKLYL